MPQFSVIMATYDRGRHILPSIQSVLRQTCQDFELLVVGDCCTDETEHVVRTLASPQIRWLNLPKRGGSQSFPNNAGIEMSRGRYIAYLGHDDIWAPDHLQALAQLFAADPQPDFAVSGAIFHGPRASNFRQVTGIFGDTDAALTHFFPPSSFGHRRDVTDRIGQWRHPQEIAPPVDADFLLRAARSGMTFVSTQRITVQKFAAGHRYLSYLGHTSDEQYRMAKRMALPGYDGYLASEIAKAKAADAFMIITHPDYEQYEIGQLARQNLANKGILRPALRALRRQEVIKQDNAPRALDWCPFSAGDERMRWVGSNPRPKLLVPFSYAGTARISLDIWHFQPQVLAGLALRANSRPATATILDLRQEGHLWRARATFETMLRTDSHTVLELHLNRIQRPAGLRPGIGMGDIEVTPLGWRSVVGRGTRLMAKFRPAR